MSEFDVTKLKVSVNPNAASWFWHVRRFNLSGGWSQIRNGLGQIVGVHFYILTTPRWQFDITKLKEARKRNG